MFLGIKDDKKIIWFLKPKTYPNPAPCPKLNPKNARKSATIKLKAYWYTGTIIFL